MDPRRAGLLCLLCILGIAIPRCHADLGGAVEQCKERMRARGYECFEEGRAGIDSSPLEDVPIGSGNAQGEHREMCGAARDMWAANGMGEPDAHDAMTVLADGTVCVRRSGAGRNDSDGEIARSTPTEGRKLAGNFADSTPARRFLREAGVGSGGSGRGVLQLGGGGSFGVEPGLPDTSFGRVRVPLDRSTDEPLRMVGQLSLGCSATLVGPCHYLTAGHCVWNDETFQLRAGMDFNPGRNGRELGNPLGRWQAVQVHPATGFALYGDGTSDAALVQVVGTPGLELG
ncbi:unnamed protein product [Ostreobium quekettii]|uniref:Serine protease n=1 Tax=Ostreobium quekettii TaxID=121088 RepID=A0A8S1IRJ2_9CHLO|nr:unnamed protein product [Ostreobium quekettii]|eukprot:evm.model.scf_118.8 EVM.evm.TU.scf_118.8   scf_118:139246-140106(-)